MLFVATLAAPALAAAPTWQPLFEARARWEWLDTPVARADQDEAYDFGLLRVRAGGEVAWAERFRVRFVVQGATTTELPEAAALGGGQVYFATNGGDRTPSQAGLAELAFVWSEPGFRLTAGRQGRVDGAEPATGVAHLDWVKRRRVGERLVGNLDFPNVGRRYDGATLSIDLGEAAVLDAYALRPLAGAFHYDDAFERLDVDLYGATATARYGRWLGAAEARVFALGYRDVRPVAKAAAGGAIELTTVGGSVLAGNERWDLLGWVALQRGDWGSRDQRSWAALVEGGRRFAAVAGAPSLHFGYERASGGAATGDRGTFFNLLPTNHKFYGAMDYFAFSNLRDLFVEARWNATPKLSLVAAAHDFALVDERDAWYAGSGPMSDRELGYAARRPPSGRFASKSLGRELDVAATLALPRRCELKLEAGLFAGRAALREVMPRDQDGHWVALELTWKR